MKTLRYFLSEYLSVWPLALVVLALILGMWLAYPQQVDIAHAGGTITLVSLVSSTPSPTPTETTSPTATPAATSSPVPSPTRTAPPTATPTPTYTPSPTPLPAFLVWSPEGVGGYLRATPNGEILTLLENGAYVEYLGEQDTVSGLDWWFVQAFFETSPHAPPISQDGWVAAMLLYPVPDGELLRVASPEGVYLRESPQGNIVTWLGNGAPVVKIAEQDEWTQVQTLNALDGWILSRLLQPLDLPR